MKTKMPHFFGLIAASVVAAILSKPSWATTVCDKLGALEADPSAVSAPVAFQDINSEALISSCTDEMAKQDDDLPRYLLQRGRGYLRAGQSELAVADINASHSLGYPAGTFGLATAFFLGDDVQRNDLRAEQLFIQAYKGGVYWAARGLASLYGDPASELFDLDQSEIWEDRFQRGQQVSKIISFYRKQCYVKQEEFIELAPDGYIPPSQLLQIDEGSVYELRISEDQIAS
jgi:hypothetical protein